MLDVYGNVVVSMFHALTVTLGRSRTSLSGLLLGVVLPCTYKCFRTFDVVGSGRARQASPRAATALSLVKDAFPLCITRRSRAGRLRGGCSFWMLAETLRVSKEATKLTFFCVLSSGLYPCPCHCVQLRHLLLPSLLIRTSNPPTASGGGSEQQRLNQVGTTGWAAKPEQEAILRANVGLEAAAGPTGYAINASCQGAAVQWHPAK